MANINELIKQSIAIEKQIKEAISLENINKQKIFAPEWFVYKNWDDDGEYCIEFIRDISIYAIRVSQNEFIKPYNECREMFEKGR